MIVCVCKNVNTSQIRESLAAGMSLEAISTELGLGTGCGQCLEYAAGYIQREQPNLIQSMQVT